MMAYRLRPDEAVADGVRRIATEQIDKATDDLARADRHEAIHEFRKRCKKIRALLRLVRPSLGETYRAENASFREMARDLSELRDATSLIEACGDLASGDAAFESVRDALKRRRAQLFAQRDPDRRLAACGRALRDARKRVESWSLDDRGFDAVAGGLTKTYKRARRRMGDAYDEGGTESFHEWRKRVKYHRYHVRLLRDSWRAVLDPWRDELHRLTDLLGDDHDLAVLGKTVAESEAIRRVADLAALAGAIAGRRADLQSRARPLGGRLLTEKPRRLTDRHRGYWLASRQSG